ncbi:MAG: SDR family NAD(P)-dependent oxidoreductase [Betaproteobacteria bacterium]|nr:SDR family NAD(P)-dependent oxidoreductase [Betaproteobacteria bacterium]
MSVEQGKETLGAGRVAIVSGAGAGLGLAYVEELLQQGFRVVVNDLQPAVLDAALKGLASKHPQAAQHAVGFAGDIAEMETAQELVGLALSQFGRLDAVINNAGLLRDKMFAGLDVSDFDLVMRVHLRGHFCLSRVAVQHWRDQAKAGQQPVARIVNTTSGAGLQGSVGQSNYSAAKGGIAALTLVQAAELARYGITANALAPAARTAMTLAGMPDLVKAPSDGSFDHYDPRNVAGFVAWLCSAESQQVTGQIFEVDGDRIGLAEGWVSGPDQRKGGARWEPHEVGAVVNTLLAQRRPAQKVWGSA